MLKNILFVGVFVLLLGCGRYGNGYRGWDENYVEPGTGFTLWIPKKLHSRLYDSSVVEDYAKTCGQSQYLDINLLPEPQDVYKDDADGVRTYAFSSRYSVYKGRHVTLSGPDVNRTIYHDYIFNVMMNQKGEVLDCDYIHMESISDSPISNESFKLPILIFR